MRVTSRSPPRGEPRGRLTAALDDGAIDAARVDYINAHGTGTPLNDVSESEAIREVFGDRAATLPVSSTKSMHGHTLGASGALEAAATVLALENGGRASHGELCRNRPRMPLDCVPNEARDAESHVALSSSFAFGGLNAVLAFAAPSL